MKKFGGGGATGAAQGSSQWSKLVIVCRDYIFHYTMSPDGEHCVSTGADVDRQL